MSGRLPAPNTEVYPAVTKVFFPHDFSFLDKIDEGGEAVCFRGMHGTYGEVCAKLFHSHVATKSNKKEIEVFLKHSFHPNVVRFFGFYAEDQHLPVRGQVGYVMEYMPGGSLHSEIYSNHHYDYTKACSWLTQAARGLQYLHEAHIIHRDVKPRNMLLDNHREVLKISDFGLVKMGDHSQFTGSAGTFHYTAPEIMASDGRTRYGTSADIYSMGITFWEILHRRRPFDLHGWNLYEYVRDGGRPPVSDGFDQETRRLLQSSWGSEPNSRCSVEDIIAFGMKRSPHMYAPPPVQQPPSRVTGKVAEQDGTRFVQTGSQEEEHVNLLGMHDGSYYLKAYLMKMKPKSFEEAVMGIRLLLTLFKEHVNEKKFECKDHSSMYFSLGRSGLQPTKEKVYNRTVEHYESELESDFNVFADVFQDILYVSYNLAKYHHCTSGKVQKFEKELNEMEEVYEEHAERVQSFLARREFNCLIVGDWQQMQLYMDSMEKTGVLKRYPMNYNYLEIDQTTTLSQCRDHIFQMISIIGQVHKIVFLLDRKETGKISNEWKLISHPTNSVFYALISRETNVTDEESKAEVEKLRQKYRNQFEFKGRILIDSIVFTKGDTFEDPPSSMVKVFNHAYNDCIIKLIHDIPPFVAYLE